MRCGDGRLEGQMKLAISIQESMSLFGARSFVPHTSHASLHMDDASPKLKWNLLQLVKTLLVSTSYSLLQSTAAACSEEERRQILRIHTNKAGNREFSGIDCLSTMMLAQSPLKSFKHLPWNEDLETKALLILIS